MQLMYPLWPLLAHCFLCSSKNVKKVAEKKWHKCNSVWVKDHFY